jgi:hypothetical protein
MAQASDIAIYQKLTEMADELDQMVAEGASIVGEVALTTASKTVRGMATAVYQRIMADRDDELSN